LSKLYFYSLEFGILEDGKIIGAGILGSCNETEHAGKGNIEVKDWDLYDICNEDFTLSDMQPHYYCIGSIKSFYKRIKQEFNKI